MENRTNKTEREKMKTNNQIATKELFSAYRLYIDTDLSDYIAKEYNTECVAVKNDEFGFGIWFTKSGLIGIYGDSEASKAFISKYYDKHQKEIEKAFKRAKDISEMITIVQKVIASTIREKLIA